jgi:hypothetical protein
VGVRREAQKEAMRMVVIRWAVAAAVSMLAGVACTTEVIKVVPGAAGAEPGQDGVAEDGPREADPSTPATSLLEGVAVTGIAVFQGVKIDLLDAKGAWIAPGKRNAPVVAGRTAVIRAYVTPAAGWAAQSVTAELRLLGSGAKTPVLRATRAVAGPSSDAAPATAFDFDVPGEAMAADVTFQVSLTGDGAVSTTGDSDARFPRDGSALALGARASGKLRVVVVPVKYDADGSGRVPDTSAAQLERYRRVFVSRYPTSDVEVTVRQPLSWTTPIARNGSGFSTVLRAITQLRQDDRAPSDVYYYGALAPAASFGQFCSSSCVLGLSAVVDDASTSLLRASVGVGYGNDESASTAAHEIGHAHGREHAPCGGAQGTDPAFPYSGGGIGVWGYDILSKTFLSPSKGKDMMGYCPNEWVSDYTYAALFDRITAVSKPSTATPASPVTGPGGSLPAAARETWRLATVEGDGTVSGASDVALDADAFPRGGEARDVSYASGAGTTVGTRSARFYRFDHLPGGMLLLPTRIGADWSRATVRGITTALAR